MILAEGPEGKREIPIREFFIFVRKTALKKDEIVTAIRVPYHAGSEGVYTKISRRREVDLSTVCATVVRDGGRLAHRVRLRRAPPLCGSSRPRSCSAAKSWTAR